jgi:hypothetical protein
MTTAKRAAPRGGKIRYTGMKTTVTVWGKQYEITAVSAVKIGLDRRRRLRGTGNPGAK